MQRTKRLLATDSGLKPRIILGSLALAVVVSAIFISVSYRLATDLGKRVQSDSVETQAQTLLHALEYDSTHHDQALLNRDYLDQLLAQNFNTAHILVQTPSQTLEFGRKPTDLFARNLDWLKQTQEMSGMIEADSETYMWAKATSSANQLDVLLLTPVQVYKTGLESMAQRLSFTAFITLWVAIWGALSLSSIISKRFEGINNELREAASRDDLTGLYNRIYMLESLDARLDQMDNTASAEPGALFLMGLNRFKEINETIGSKGADDCLIAVSKKFKLCLPEGTELYRYGGDEFAFWTSEFNEQALHELAQKMTQACAEPLEIGGWTFNLSVAIGIALFPKDALNPKDLLHCTDIALQDAKKSRRAVQFYNAQHDENTQLKTLLRNQIPEAIASAEFNLTFQPKIDLVTGAIKGVEALARWQHATLGNIPPDIFIPLIEQGREINAFSRLMLHSSIKQAKRWHDEGKEIPIAVNLSPYNLLDNNMLPFIEGQLEVIGLPPRLLEVELTESAAMLDPQLAQSVFTRLRNMGVRVSIDDFGTGMSSMSYLQNLPVDCIKLDRSFIENIESDEVAHAIVACMISLCHTLGKVVIAEGVESRSQANALKQLGCDQAQGYLFSRPLEVDDHELIRWFVSEVPAEKVI